MKNLSKWAQGPAFFPLAKEWLIKNHNCSIHLLGYWERRYKKANMLEELIPDTCWSYLRPPRSAEPKKAGYFISRISRVKKSFI